MSIKATARPFHFFVRKKTITHRRLTRQNCHTCSKFCLQGSDKYVVRGPSNGNTRLFRSETGEDGIYRDQLQMENIYQQWTLDDDKLLFENRNENLATLASMLGRGLRGVESRLNKIRDVNSSAYQRLFVDNLKLGKSGQNDVQDEMGRKHKLVPASEVLRRIQWDESLSLHDFFILHYDRVDDQIVQSSMAAPNKSISGQATSLIDALPEHRIVAIKYKERIVWDRRTRTNLIFSDQVGGEDIKSVIAGYEEWKLQRDCAIARNRQRQEEVTLRLQQILGLERFEKLKQMSNEAQGKISVDSSRSGKQYAEQYVKDALEIFREVRDDPSESTLPECIPMSDYDAFNTISELVSLLPDLDIRTFILNELELRSKLVVGRRTASDSEVFSLIQKRPLPEISEDDLVEAFVRGSGPGGQKINKTSNRVVLVHKPTQLRVECQDTRSLQQNRKIARKRLQQKLDEYLYGNESKTAIVAAKASIKKAKSKARARARVRKKQQNVEGDSFGIGTDDKECD